MVRGGALLKGQAGQQGAVRAPQFGGAGAGVAGVAGGVVPAQPQGAGAVGGQLGGQPVAGQAGGGAVQQVDIPENAGKPPLVLAFQVAAVAPLQHRRREGVLPRAEKIGDVEGGGAVADLAVAGEGVVHIQVEAAVHPFQHKVQPAAGAGPGGEPPVVDAGGVFVRHKGRVKGEGIAEVQVLGGAVPLQLPAGGHRDAGPFAGGEDLPQPGPVGRGGPGAWVVGELPFAVEGGEAGGGFPRGKGVLAGGEGDEVVGRRQGAQLQHREILVAALFDQFLHKGVSSVMGPGGGPGTGRRRGCGATPLPPAAGFTADPGGLRQRKGSQRAGRPAGRWVRPRRLPAG